MMGREKNKKDEGEKILNNYKKQIAEKMARDKAERGDTLSSVSSKKRGATGGNTSGKGKGKDDYESFGFGGGAMRSGLEMNNNEPPEPEVLLSILHRRTKK